MAKRGRPSKFTTALAEELCSRLSKGETLTSICRDDHMPETRTVSDWKADEKFAADFARARDEGFDAIASECLEIADDSGRDTRLVGESETPVANTEWIARSKLRVETRLKLLAKWDPKRYGDKLALTGGAPSDAPIHIDMIQLVPMDDGRSVD